MCPKRPCPTPTLATKNLACGGGAMTEGSGGSGQTNGWSRTFSFQSLNAAEMDFRANGRSTSSRPIGERRAPARSTPGIRRYSGLARNIRPGVPRSSGRLTRRRPARVGRIISCLQYFHRFAGGDNTNTPYLRGGCVYNRVKRTGKLATMDRQFEKDRDKRAAIGARHRDVRAQKAPAFG